MPKTVLLIDSQMAARRMLRFAMELYEYRVVELADASGAQAALTGNCPDLLVIGINASDAGQQTLLSQLRQQPAFALLPVLLVGENRCRPRWDLRTIGNCAWLDKPFCMGEFHHLVDTLLAPSRLPLPRSTAARDERPG